MPSEIKSNLHIEFLLAIRISDSIIGFIGVRYMYCMQLLDFYVNDTKECNESTVLLKDA